MCGILALKVVVVNYPPLVIHSQPVVIPLSTPRIVLVICGNSNLQIHLERVAEERDSSLSYGQTDATIFAPL